MPGIFDGTTNPTVLVEFGARNSTTGLFVIGTSTLNSGSDLVATGTPWATVSADLLSQVAIRRGRSRDDADVDPGEVTLVLDNADGQFDPDNHSATNPWTYLGRTQLRPGMPVRVSAVYSATTYRLFTGTLEKAVPTHGYAPTASFTAVDGMARVAAYTVPSLGQETFGGTPIYDYGGETTAARVGRILDMFGWPSADRTISGSRTLLPTNLGRSALDLIEEAGRAEAGRVYVAANGAFTVLAHTDGYTRPTRFTLADDAAAGTVEFESLTTSPGYDSVVNRVTVKRDYPNVVDYTGEDGTSISDYGVRGAPDYAAPLESDTDAADLADFLAHRRSRPASRLDGVTFEAVNVGAVWASILATELGDRVAARRTTTDGRALSWTGTVEEIRHTITPDSWQVDLSTAPLDVLGLYGSADAFVVSVSQLNSTDVLAPY